jgi:glutathione S-transferase
LQGRQWLTGDRFTLADIALLTIVDFAGWIDIKPPETLAALHDWHARATARLA